MKVRNDLRLYENHAAQWWRPGDRFFRSLRSVGEFHLRLLEREWGARIAGARIADLGSGGGFMSLALSGLGAHVIGVDRSPGSVQAAYDEARRRRSSSRFLCADLLACPMPAASFDLVVMGDVLEHLEQPALAIKEAGRLLRPGGRLFVNTFDRSWCSRLTVVSLGEGLGFIPRGTHDARLFVRPEELDRYAHQAGMKVDRLVWEKPAVVHSVLTWTIHLKQANGGFGYSAFLTRQSA